MLKPKVSIVIVSFNTKKLIVDCIKSIKSATNNLDYEIIVVDNNSVDNSLEAIRKLKYKNISFIENKDNRGFAKANNQGISLAKGKYILLLNSDTYITSNVISDVVGWMDKHEKVGIASCSLLNKDLTMQGSGGFFPTPLRVFMWMFFLDDIPGMDSLVKPFHPMHTRSLYKNESYFNKTQSQDWVTGAFFLIREQVIEQVGAFDEDFFMYTEEVELCYRAKLAGWKVMLLPEWSIIHYGQASGSSEFATLSEWKGIRLFYQKHYSFIWQVFIRVCLFIGALLRMIIFGILEGRKGFKVYAQAITKS